MDLQIAKQYRNVAFVILGFSAIVSLTGLIIMFFTRGGAISSVLTKIGISGIMAAYLLSLYVAVRRRNSIGKSTKVVLWIMIIASLPIVYGLITILFLR